MRIALLTLILSLSLFAQSVETSAIVSQCEALLEADQFDSVVTVTKDYLGELDDSEDAQYVAPYLMEARVELGLLKSALRTKRKFIGTFPNSSELDQIHYLAGIAQAKDGEYVDATLEFSVSEAYSTEDSTIAKLKRNIDLLGRNHLSLSELDALLEEALSPRTKESLTYWYAIKMKNSNTLAADSLLESFKELWPNSSYNTEATVEVRREDAVIAQFQEKTIALMAPLTGSRARLGKEALNTVSLVLRNHEERTGETINLVVVDTKASSVVTAIKTAELIDRNVTAIIGPIMSEPATIAAAMLMDHPEIVMISPTATEDGIAGLGRNVFQLNLTTRALAEKIARYSVENLGIRDFAIIAPISDYGRLMTEYFTGMVLELGGEIVFSDYFTPSAHDHNGQFMALRESFADKKYGRYDSLHTRSQSELRERGAFVEDSVVAVGGLFVPSSAENAVKFAAEIPFYNIQTQFMGSSSWKNSANTLLNEGDRYINNAIFSSGHSASTGTDWSTFSAAFHKTVGQEPGTIVAPRVYDATTLLLTSIEGSGSGADVIEKLRSISAYNGLSGEISLDNETGVNSGAVIMKVSNGEIRRVQ